MGVTVFDDKLAELAKGMFKNGRDRSCCPSGWLERSSDGVQPNRRGKRARGRGRPCESKNLEQEQRTDAVRGRLPLASKHSRRYKETKGCDIRGAGPVGEEDEAQPRGSRSENLPSRV